MGVHSSFFGPIKYAILPQHLHKDEVLGGTGLVEAGTYGAILIGTIAGGLIPAHVAAAGVLLVAAVGRLTGGQVPPAPPVLDAPHPQLDQPIHRPHIPPVRGTEHIPPLFPPLLPATFSSA